MASRKPLIIITSILGAMITIALGLQMLPDNLQLIWLGFNAYMWIVSPIVLLEAAKRERRR